MRRDRHRSRWGGRCTGVDAAFEGFRAIGGFVISAGRMGGVTRAIIKSEAGMPAALKTGVRPSSVACQGAGTPFVYDENIVRFDTRAGMVYEVVM